MLVDLDGVREVRWEAIAAISARPLPEKKRGKAEGECLVQVSTGGGESVEVNVRDDDIDPRVVFSALISPVTDPTVRGVYSTTFGQQLLEAWNRAALADAKTALSKPA